MLHITDGESVAGTLRESAIPGVVSIYGDLMFEGPAPAGLDTETWRETRARFMADAGFGTLEETRQYCPVGEAQFRTAQAAWNAFTSPAPTAIEPFLETDTSALPFI